MTTPITNPSPKKRFQQSGDSIAKHRDLVESKEFQRGCDFALLQYQHNLALLSVDNGNAAAAAHFKLVGVHEFLNHFRLLAEVTTTTKAMPNENLTP